MIGDVLLNTNFDNKEKFKQMVLESKARMEAQVVSSGHRYSEYTCFTSTKARILTPKGGVVGAHSFAAGRIGARYVVSEFVEEQVLNLLALLVQKYKY